MKHEDIDWGMNKYMHPFKDKITDEFKKFWLDTHDSVDHEKLIHTDEYWIRCAFCWAGWNGHENRKFKNKKVKNGKRRKNK